MYHYSRVSNKHAGCNKAMQVRIFQKSIVNKSICLRNFQKSKNMQDIVRPQDWNIPKNQYKRAACLLDTPEYVHISRGIVGVGSRSCCRTPARITSKS